MTALRLGFAHSFHKAGFDPSRVFEVEAVEPGDFVGAFEAHAVADRLKHIWVVCDRFDPVEVDPRFAGGTDLSEAYTHCLKGMKVWMVGVGR
jgi:hypothetical protein